MKPIKQNNLTFTWNNKCSCYQFSLPPRQSCPGVKKRLKDPRSVCNFCYAFNGRSGQMKTAQALLQKNMDCVAGLYEGTMGSRFAAAMRRVSQHKSSKYFRWMGCGDIANKDLFYYILRLAATFPEIKFWCPTHVAAYTKVQKPNLVFRQSAIRIGDPAPPGGHTALLPEQKSLKGHFICPGKCGPCRKCWEPWDPKTRIAFPFHGSACLWAKFNKARRVNGF